MPGYVRYERLPRIRTGGRGSRRGDEDPAADKPKQLESALRVLGNARLGTVIARLQDEISEAPGGMLESLSYTVKSSLHGASNRVGRLGGFNSEAMTELRQSVFARGDLLLAARRRRVPAMLGRIERVLEGRVRARVDVGDLSLPVEFPKRVLSRLDLRPGALFSWHPSDRTELREGDFAPVSLVHGSPSKRDVRAATEEFFARRSDKNLPGDGEDSGSGTER